MKSQAKFGSRINLSIIRANGRIEHRGDFYNHPRDFMLTASGASIRGASPGNLNFRASTDAAVELLAGTWSQSGTTISRATGTGTLPTSASFYKFANGSEPGVRVAGSGTSITVSRSATVSAQQLYRFENANITLAQDLGGLSSSRSYSAGVVTIFLAAPASFAPATSAYTLRSIYQSQIGVTNSDGVMIQINPPVAIGVGDVIVINSYEYKFDYGGHQPRAFAVSPITGLSGTGRFQRTRRITTRDNANSPVRIFLLTDANKITLPDMFGPTGGTLLDPSSYTIVETITATGSTTSPSATNDYTESHSCFGNTASAHAAIKQIAWGTTTEIFGIIEYDTPVAIASGKVLTVGMSTRLVPVLTLP